MVKEKKDADITGRDGSYNYHDTGVFVVYAGVGIQKVEESNGAILHEMSLLTKEKVTSEELIKGKEYIKGRLSLSLEDSQEVAQMYGLRELLEKRMVTVEEVISLVERVTREDILRVAKRLFRTEKLNLSVIGPFGDPGHFLKLLKV